MKKLTVIVKPANREEVIDIMESCAVYGAMETDITGYGKIFVEKVADVIRIRTGQHGEEAL